MTIRFASVPVALANIRITSPFGTRSIDDGIEPHNAVDIAAPVGTPLLAVSDGTVLAIINNDRCGTGIVLLHKQVGPNPGRTEYTTGYCHMEAGSVTRPPPTGPGLTVGAKVKAGQIIGKVGMTGRTFGPHLHFTLKEVVGRAGGKDNPIDPEPYIRGVGRQFASQQAVTPSIAASSAGVSPFIESLESFHPSIGGNCKYLHAVRQTNIIVKSKIR